MRLIDIDEDLCPIYADDDNITGFWMTSSEIDAYNDGINATMRCIMSRPTVQAVPIEVLDKIRAEIAEYKDNKIIHEERNEMIDIVLEIIDKYRESGEV